jgi:hypothetical protein
VDFMLARPTNFEPVSFVPTLFWLSKEFLVSLQSFLALCEFPIAARKRQVSNPHAIYAKML